MANPNIVNVSDIRGKTAVINVTTDPTTLVTNSPSSDTVVKLNCLLISNTEGNTSADINVDIYRGSNAYYLVKTVNIPADASLDVLAKTIYLEEGDSLRVQGSANSFLQAVCSYEVIS